MAIADRKFSKEAITTFTVGTEEMAARLKNVAITNELEVMQNPALLDDANFETPGRSNWEVTFEEAVEGADALKTLLANRTEFTWTMVLDYETISSTGILTRCNRDYSDGINRTYRIGPRGAELNIT